MILLFKKIRQKLSQDPSAGRALYHVIRYLADAIGEIFLVVIGIPIALHSNSWNGNRKYSSHEGDCYTDMQNNLDKDL